LLFHILEATVSNLDQVNGYHKAPHNCMSFVRVPEEVFCPLHTLMDYTVSGLE